MPCRHSFLLKSLTSSFDSREPRNRPELRPTGSAQAFACLDGTRSAKRIHPFASGLPEQTVQLFIGGRRIPFEKDRINRVDQRVPNLSRRPSAVLDSSNRAEEHAPPGRD